MRVDAATAWSLGLWFVLGLVPTVGETMGWQVLANHQGLAAWVQALGSIGAIAAAFMVANAQNKRAQLDRWAALAGPAEVKGQLLRAIGREAKRLQRPAARADEPDWLRYVGLQKAADEARIAKLRELVAALVAIPLAEVESALELVVLISAREAVKNLFVGVDALDTGAAARTTIGASADELLNLGEGLLAYAKSIRLHGPRTEQ